MRVPNIHHNQIVRDSRKFESSQRSGMMINRGSVCNIFNNAITDGTSRGIHIQGNGGNRVYNNLIIRPGRLEATGDSGGSGIVVSTGSNTDQSIYVWNNTIVDPKAMVSRSETTRATTTGSKTILW